MAFVVFYIQLDKVTQEYCSTDNWPASVLLLVLEIPHRVFNLCDFVLVEADYLKLATLSLL